MPHADHLVETGTHMIKLQMGGWVDANCITDHWTVQGRLKGEEEWSSAASRVEPGEEFTLRYLTPATWFHVKVLLSTKIIIAFSGNWYPSRISQKDSLRQLNYMGIRSCHPC